MRIITVVVAQRQSVGLWSQMLRFQDPSITPRGLSSVGRAGALQASGHRFEPDRFHHLGRAARTADGHWIWNPLLYK